VNYDDLATLPRAEQNVHMLWAINHTEKRIKLWDIPVDVRDEMLEHIHAVQSLAATYGRVKVTCARCKRTATKSVTVENNGAKLTIHGDCLIAGDAVISRN
jgi:hypothetical protein